ncbi:hypothetical protein ACLKOZ_06895 [Arthrobacter sp. R4]|uniref:hypothetical protein n=1 Tax=Arthrobacter sp. R4 TaxID=644417 RepID=UPI003EDA30D7
MTAARHHLENLLPGLSATVATADPEGARGASSSLPATSASRTTGRTSDAVIRARVAATFKEAVRLESAFFDSAMAAS